MPRLCHYRTVFVLAFMLVLSSFAPSFAQQSTSPVVSLTVPLRDNDIALTLTRTDGRAITEEDKTLTYQITYSSALSNSVPLTLQASWSNAFINGSSVQLADYVTNSATTAYNNTPAIIDTIHKTITWNIPSLPANTTDQTVSFRLKTNSNYIGFGNVSFSVNAQAISNGQALTPVTLTQYYAHTQPSLNASSSSSSPTSAPAPTSTPTPTLLRVTPSLFSSVAVQTIASKNATMHLSLREPSFLTIRYGTSPTHLVNSLKVAEKVTEYTITLPDLLPNTVYYFTITATSDTRTSTSDIYTFTTAKTEASSVIDPTSFILTADNLILTSSAYGKDAILLSHIPTAVITTDTPYEFRFGISHSDTIQKIIALVRDANTLGINTFTTNAAQDVSMNEIEIAEIARGVYTGRLKTALRPGRYTLLARISDTNGNITEQSLATLTVVSPLTVLEKGSQRPIENARIVIYRKAPRTNQYTLLSEQSIPLKNPLFTKPDGTIENNLIPGDYKIHVSAIGYTPVDMFFTISPASQTQYPTVELSKEGFSITNTLSYYSEAASDFLSSLTNYLENIGISHRLFNLVSLLALVLFVIVTTLSFCIRFHIPVSALPAYFFSHLQLHRTQKTAKTLSGTVLDSEGFPLHDAIIYLLDRRRKRILLHTQTNKLGQFTLSLPDVSSYLILVKKRHYLSLEQSVTPFEELTLTLQKDPASKHSILHAVQLFFMNILGLGFEMLLFSSFVLELLFSMSLGIVTVLPYILVTLFNLILWLLFIKNQKSVYLPTV